MFDKAIFMEKTPEGRPVRQLIVTRDDTDLSAKIDPFKIKVDQVTTVNFTNTEGA